MKSLFEDVQADISNIKAEQKIFEQRLILLDSLIVMLNEPAITKTHQTFIIMQD